VVGTEEIVELRDVLEVEAVDCAVAEQAGRHDGWHLLRVRSGIGHGYVVLEKLADELGREDAEAHLERDFTQDLFFCLEAPADIEVNRQGLRCLAQRHDVELCKVRHDVERVANGHGIALEKVIECRIGLLTAEEIETMFEHVLESFRKKYPEE